MAKKKATMEEEMKTLKKHVGGLIKKPFKSAIKCRNYGEETRG